jgi:rubredoxin
MPDARYCPSCKADMRDEPIPAEHAEHYAGEYIDGVKYFSKWIGIYDREQDRTVAWQCPECKEEYKRER